MSGVFLCASRLTRPTFGGRSRPLKTLSRPHGRVLGRIRSTECLGSHRRLQAAIGTTHVLRPRTFCSPRRRHTLTSVPRQAVPTHPAPGSLPVVTTPPADLPAGRTSAFVAGQRRKVIAQLVVRRAAYITIASGKMVPDSELAQIAAARFEIYRAAGSLVEHAPQAARRRALSVDRMKQIQLSGNQVDRMSHQTPFHNVILHSVFIKKARHPNAVHESAEDQSVQQSTNKQESRP